MIQVLHTAKGRVRDHVNMNEIDMTTSNTKMHGHQASSETLKDEGNALFKAHEFVNALSKYDEGLDLDPQNKAIRSNRCSRTLRHVLVMA